MGSVLLPVSADAVTKEKLERVARSVLGSTTELAKGTTEELVFLRRSFWESANGVAFELQELVGDEAIVRVRHVAPREAAVAAWTMAATSLVVVAGSAFIVSPMFAGFLASLALAVGLPTAAFNRSLHLKRINATISALEDVEW